MQNLATLVSTKDVLVWWFNVNVSGALNIRPLYIFWIDGLLYKDKNMFSSNQHLAKQNEEMYQWMDWYNK